MKFQWILFALSACLVLFVALPFVALAMRTDPESFAHALRSPIVVPALQLSLVTTTATVLLAVLFGTPLAWLLASSESRAPRWLETFFQLPVVIPPAVAGIALLLAFGRAGILHDAVYPHGFSLAFSTFAVVLAQLFVSAPFYVQAATLAFRRLPPSIVPVARSLGASPSRVFFRVALPLATPGIVVGAAMSFARALGEFGATLMFAGNLPGKTQTLPLAIYAALESDLRVAQALALLLTAFAFLVLFVLRFRFQVKRDD